MCQSQMKLIRSRELEIRWNTKEPKTNLLAGRQAGPPWRISNPKSQIANQKSIYIPALWHYHCLAFYGVNA